MGAPKEVGHLPTFGGHGYQLVLPFPLSIPTATSVMLPRAMAGPVLNTAKSDYQGHQMNKENANMSPLGYLRRMGSPSPDPPGAMWSTGLMPSP